MKVILLIMMGFSLSYADYIRDDTKEVVLDTTTNLMWQDDADIDRTWLDAKEYCKGLNLGDFNDWRLPNFNELYLLADRTVSNPAINPIFTNVVSSSYWSYTTYEADTTAAWLVHFADGGDTAFKKSTKNYVRCVR